MPDADSRRDAVDCDYECGAFADPNPDNPAELLAALEHWRDHSLWGGCSHAA